MLDHLRCAYEVLAAAMFRMMFRRVIKQRVVDEVLFKTYISSIKTFEFGPLPAGQEPELYVTYCYATFFFVVVISYCRMTNNILH